MAHISGQIHIDAAPELVFDTVADSRNEPLFNPQMREVELLTDFSHPGIVHYIAHGVVERRRFLVMEWVEGKTLSQILTHGLTLRESVSVIRRSICRW